MADEMNVFYTVGYTLYSVIRNAAGEVWYPVGEAVETWGTGARTAADYDIALTDKSAGMYVGDLPAALPAGYYTWVAHHQQAGAPADTDPAVYKEYGYWDGDEWWTVGKRVAATSAGALSLEELKNFLGVDSDDDDALIAQLLTAAMEWCALYQGRTYLTLERTLVLDAFHDVIRLPYPPIQSVDSIEYVDTNGVTQTLAESVYRTDLITEPARITLEYNQSWPDIRSVTNAVTITYTAGYGDADDIPDSIQAAIHLAVHHLYQFARSISESELPPMPNSVKLLLGAERIVSL
jgi:uncharacterized phiE125 gp8 family phage protein